MDNIRITFDAQSLNLPEGESLLHKMMELGGREVTGDEPAVVYSQRYRFSNRVHHATLIVQENRSGDASITMHALLGAGRRRYEEQDLGPPLKWLGQKEISGTARCFVSYLLPRRTFKPLIPLPLQMFQKGSTRFERLMGFRLATGTGEAEETLIIDVDGNTFHVVMVFNEQIEIDETLMKKVTKMSKDLVMPLMAKSEEIELWYALNN